MADKEVTTKLILQGEPGGLVAAMNKVDAALAGTKKQSDLLTEAGQKLGGVFAGIGIAALAKQAIDAGLQMERLTKLFNAVTGSVSLGAREMEYARQVADKMGLSFVDTAESYGKFLAATRNTTLEGEKGRKVFESVSGAAAALGLRADETAGIFNALQQMMSKGKVQAEELRGQLGERLPGAFKMAADAMGVTTAELDKMLVDGKLMADDLLPKLAAQLDKTYGKAAQEGAKGAAAEMNRLNTAMFDLKGTAGAALIPVFTDVVKALRPAMGLLQEFIGGIQILAVKAAAIPDRIGAAWQVVKSGKGLFSAEGMNMYGGLKSQIDANENAAIDDIMKRFSSTGSDYNAAELARQAGMKPTKPLDTKKPKDDTNTWQASHEQYLQYEKAFNDRLLAISKGAMQAAQYQNEQGYANGIVSLQEYLDKKQKAVIDQMEAERISALENLDQRQQDLVAKAKIADAKKGDAEAAKDYHTALKQVEEADTALINVENKLHLQRLKDTEEYKNAIHDETISNAASLSHWAAIREKETDDELKAEFEHRNGLAAMAAELTEKRLSFLGKEEEALQVRHDAERQRVIDLADHKLATEIMTENEKRRLNEETTARLVQLDQAAAEQRAQIWWNNAQQYIGFAQSMTTMAVQMLMAEEGQKNQIGKRMLATSVRFIAQGLQAYMFGKAKEHLLNAAGAAGRTQTDMVAATANLTILEAQATAWAAFFAAMALNPYGGQSFAPAATAMTAVAGVAVPAAMTIVGAAGAVGIAGELGMAAAWAAGGIAAGALGEAGASAIEGGLSGNAAGYGAGTPGSPVITQPVQQQATQQIHLSLNFNGTVLADDQKLKRWAEDDLAPMMRDLTGRGVTFA